MRDHVKVAVLSAILATVAVVPATAVLAVQADPPPPNTATEHGHEWRGLMFAGLIQED